MRAALRRAAAVRQPVTTRRLMACQPLVAGGARHPVALAQLGHGPVPTLEVVHKREPLFDHIRFHPGHPPGVNDVPGLVLTMSPAYTSKRLTGQWTEDERVFFVRQARLEA